jgi:integrase
MQALRIQEAIRWQEAKILFEQERVDLSPVSLCNYFYTLNRLFVDDNILLVGRLHIVKFLMQYQKPISYNTNLYAIKAFFQWASEYYRIANPASGLKCKRQTDLSDARVLTEDEYQRIVPLACRYRDIAVFLANTGLRASEFCSLRPASYIGRKIRILGKGAKPREIPLNKTAWELSQKYDSKINFHLKKSNKPLQRHNLKYLCQWLAEQTGIAPFSPHALRHYFATALIHRGANIADVSKLLGHSNINITIRCYYHPAQLDAAVELLEL